MVILRHEHRQFDAIDTSNLVDHIGLLNLLVCAAPRLTPRPDSKLFTSTLLWQGDLEPASELISESLRFDVAMTPSVLGLHLVSSELQEALNIQSDVGAVSREKTFLWQPSPAPIPPITVNVSDVTRLQGSMSDVAEKHICAITRSLCDLSRVCCFLPLSEYHPQGKVSIKMSTVATVGFLVHNLCESRITLASDKSPQDLVLAICKGYCLSFAQEAEVVLRLMDRARGDLVQFTGKLYLEHSTQPTLSLRVVLVHKAFLSKHGLMGEVMQLCLLDASMAKDKDFRLSTRMTSVHFLDSVTMNHDLTTSFLLPDDHGLDLSDWKVTQISVDNPIKLAFSKIEDLTNFTATKVRPGHDLNKDKRRKKTETGTESLRVVEVREFDDMFVGYIHYEGEPEGLFTKYYQQTRDKVVSSALAVDVGFRNPEQQSVTIRFTSPVNPQQSVFSRLHAESRVMCKFIKTLS